MWWNWDEEVNIQGSIQWLYVFIMSCTCFRVNLEWPVGLNGWVFLCKLSGCGFNFHCSHLVFYVLRYCLSRYLKYYSPTCPSHLSTGSTRLSTCSTCLFTCSTRLSICLSSHSTCLSTHSIRLSTRSTHLAIRLSTRSTCSAVCWSFYNWSL